MSTLPWVTQTKTDLQLKLTTEINNWINISNPCTLVRPPRPTNTHFNLYTNYSFTAAETTFPLQPCHSHHMFVCPITMVSSTTILCFWSQCPLRKQQGPLQSISSTSISIPSTSITILSAWESWKQSYSVLHQANQPCSWK